jgi:hypothetical protein
MGGPVMAISLTSLGSRIARSKIGIRKVSTGTELVKKDSNGNALERIFNLGLKLVKSLLSGLVNLLVSGLNLGWAFVWGAIVNSVTFLSNFDWNISDKELDRQTKAAWLAFYSSAGGFLGNAAGWAVCGILPGAVMFYFNEAAALYVLKEVGEEALDEIAGNAAVLIRLLFNAAARSLFVYAFKAIRNKYFPRDKNNNKPWILSQKIEEKIESIPNEITRTIVEEAYDEFFDSCVEAGYVLANAMDSYNALQKVANRQVLGAERIVEIDLDRKAADE